MNLSNYRMEIEAMRSTTSSTILHIATRKPILQNTPFCLRQRTLADQAQILILEILDVFLPAPPALWNAKPIPLG